MRMSEKESLFPLAGKVVVAHPSRVAQADQVAADEGVETVRLSRFAPTTHVYILDLDALTKLPDEGFFRA